jgi:flagellar hook-length control protein FliK
MPDAVPTREATTKSAHPSETQPVNNPAPAGEKEQPTTASVAQIIRESEQPLTPSVQTLRPRLTLDQIKELQEMVSRAMSQTRVNLEGASEATFNWAPEGLGSMRFRITSSKDDVRIEIASNRRDVADMLESGRGTIERMIGDLGLKVERFDVKMRMEADPRETPGQSYEHRHHRQDPETRESLPGGLVPGGDAAAETEPVIRKPLVPDHEWVA